MTTFDRTGKRALWTKARAAEHTYRASLRGVAKQIGHIVRGLAPEGSLKNVSALMQALKDYSVLLDPWARSVASYMLADVTRRDRAMWRLVSKQMAPHLRREIEQAPTGEMLRVLQSSQVKLIKSIPLDAAERVQEISVEAQIASIRPEDVAKKILETQQVSESKARLIARTEVSRAAANLVQARAQYAGSQGYTWRTVGDLNVRESHKHMEGIFVPWSQPPKTDKGLAPYHAGCGPNCRCFADPIFPDF